MTTAEPRDIRLKRLTMRSMRRGIKEMDLILSAFAADRLSHMDAARLADYEALLDMGDQDLYRWITGQDSAPRQFGPLIDEISRHARGS